MENKNKKLIFIGAVIIVLLVAVIIFRSQKSNVPDNGAIPNDPLKEAILEQPLPQNSVSVPEPIDWRKVAGNDFKIEFMGAEEKTKMGIDANDKIQVLARDKKSGVVISYKVINTDADIIKSIEE